MNKKRVLWIIVLIVFIVAIVLIIKFANSKNSTNGANIVDNTYNKNSNAIVEEKTDEVEYQKVELKDGTLYSINGEQYQADIVIGENYYDTTINDMFLNPENYMEKNIEIEGMYLENLPYTKFN